MRSIAPVSDGALAANEDALATRFSSNVFRFLSQLKQFAIPKFLMAAIKVGAVSLEIPRVIFGTGTLGNLFVALSEETKLAISREWFQAGDVVVVDTAGKYGAGLALEVIGDNLRALEANPEQVIISNKLGWKRVPLETAEPTFEPGAWVGLQYDAVQCISYDGILECWEQGNELLGQGFTSQLLSVHDPDEYLAAATSEEDRARRMADILGAYKALGELRDQGKCQAIGVGSKDWKAIAAIDEKVKLDWVMLANSLTIYRHPQELLDFVQSLNERDIPVFNSAVFHAGYMVGGNSFDYRELDPTNADDQKIADYRDRFFALCEKHSVKPAQACVEFALSPPGVVSIALSSSKPERVSSNVELANTKLPEAFWHEAKELGLIDKAYPFLG